MLDHELVPLPTTLGDAPGILLKRFSAEPPTTHELLHACYHVLGYTLQVVSPHVPGSAPARVLSDDEFKAALEAADGCKDKCPKTVGALSFDWKSLALTVAQLIIQLLAK